MFEHLPIPKPFSIFHFRFSLKQRKKKKTKTRITETQFIQKRNSEFYASLLSERSSIFRDTFYNIYLFAMYLAC